VDDRRLARLIGAATASAVALGSFLVYRATLLPGMELGDSPSFQTMVGSPVITPRDGYPLYYAVSGLVLWLAGGDPAHTLNLTSAALGAIACGLIVLLGAELSRSIAGGAVAGLLVAGSYTFWSQSVIAEVYTLHIALVALTLLLLLRWSDRPATGRLAAFFAVYALSFGNHLSMILLAPPLALFLLWAAPHGWRGMLRPRIVLLAVACASAGAAQYVWNLRTFWLWPSDFKSVGDALQMFWFDVTKSDWRDTMVLRVPLAMAAERTRMYAFDVWQQFGWIPPLVAAAGAIHLARAAAARLALVAGVYVVNTVFALGYNVGDSYVFFLPAHVMVALLSAVGVAWLDARLRPRHVVAFAMMALAAVRGYQEYPALDRSGDRRPLELMRQLTSGVEDGSAVLLTDLNWQVQNGLTYFAENIRPELAWVRLSDVILYAPALVRDNQELGRSVVVTGRGKQSLDRAYGPLFRLERDPRTPPLALADVVRELPRGTPYALTVLQPSREFPVNGADLRDALAALGGGRITNLDDSGYAAVVGAVGEAPELHLTRAQPFRASARIADVDVHVRMDSWLAFDTIRRMGFGHVIANRRHTLIVERGISFVAFDHEGRPVRTAYFAGIYEPPVRYFVRLR
jgi:Protein of unknown function (DUF2723)